MSTTGSRSGSNRIDEWRTAFRPEFPSYAHNCTSHHERETVGKKSPSGDNAAAYARGKTDIHIPNISITGTPAYGMFFRNVNNLHLGIVDMRLSSGLGIRVDNHGGDRSVRATNLGRGVFCVSESGGAVINHIDLETTGNNSILLENCYNLTVGNAAETSRVANSGELRIAARDEFANSSDITFQNIQVTGTAVRESPCADGSSWVDMDVSGSYDVCN